MLSNKADNPLVAGEIGYLTFFGEGKSTNGGNHPSKQSLPPSSQECRFDVGEDKETQKELGQLRQEVL